MFQKAIFSLSIFAVLLSSCEKDIGNLGMGMMPSQDILTVRLDSLSNFNFKYTNDNVGDTIRASQFYFLLGSYIDPVFGKVRAEIFAPIYFNNPVIDKLNYNIELINAKLLITYGDSSFQYGKNVSQTISLYEMLDSIKLTDYRTLRIAPREALIGTFDLKIDTTITADSIMTIPLPNSFLTKFRPFINDTSKYTISKGPDEINKKFGQLFYGIHFKTNFDDASIIKINSFKIEIQAKVTSINDPSLVDTVTQELITSDFIDLDSYIYKHPLVSFELKPSQTVTANIGKSNQKRVYIQDMKGYKAEFQFNDIQRWLDTSKVLINVASLTIPIEYNAAFSAIPTLLLNIYKNGVVVPIFTITSQVIGTDNHYTFNVNSFMRQFLTDGISASGYHYELVAPDNNLYVNRSILLIDNAKLHLIYTKYK